MSWYTWANLQYLGDEEFNFAEIGKSLESTLDRSGLSTDVLKNLSNLISRREASFKLHWLSLIDVVAELARLSPSVAFGVQGRGEELRCVWVREYRNGRESFAYGPPDGVE
jgi:hypothetical protein